MKKTVLFLFCVAGLCGRAAAFHPLISEDLRFLGKGGRQAEFGYEYAAGSLSGNLYTNTLNTELSFGLDSETDLMITVPWAGWNYRGAADSGPGDLRLEAKFGLDMQRGWSFAVKPGLSLPTGDEGRQLGAGRGAFWTYFVAGRAAGPWQFLANFGFDRNDNVHNQEKNLYRGTAAASRDIGGGAQALAELAWETNIVKGEASHPLTGLAGLLWRPTTAFSFDAGLRMGFNGAAQDTALLFGTAFRF